MPQVLFIALNLYWAWNIHVMCSMRKSGESLVMRDEIWNKDELLAARVCENPEGSSMIEISWWRGKMALLALDYCGANQKYHYIGLLEENLCFGANDGSEILFCELDMWIADWAEGEGQILSEDGGGQCVRAVYLPGPTETLRTQGRMWRIYAPSCVLQSHAPFPEQSPQTLSCVSSGY